jgi:hypothetical protein
MKRLVLLLACLSVPAIATAQTTGRVEAFAYLLPDDGFVLPIATMDRGSLHLEARYQYEDRATVSAWAGWSFATGTDLELTVVPMVGVVAGQTQGWAPGLEASLAWRTFELYSENEFVFDAEGAEGDYFYDWSQLSWDAQEWLTLGLSVQRTRMYDSELEIERGVFAAARRGPAELSVFAFNLDGEEAFAIVALGVDL